MAERAGLRAAGEALGKLLAADTQAPAGCQTRDLLGLVAENEARRGLTNTAEMLRLVAAAVGEMPALLAALDQTRAALGAYVGFAHEAANLLEDDRDMQALKLLRAMSGHLPRYRADVDQARALAPPTAVDCPCEGSGKYFWHTEDCRNDACALAGGMGDCAGQFIACGHAPTGAPGGGGA